jgi:protein gp37
MSSKIEWLGMPGYKPEVLNVVDGCTPVSAGCGRCWAKRFAGRQINEHWQGRAFGDVRCHEDRLEIPLHWRAPRMVFVPSMGDLFHKDVPFEFIDRVLAVVALCPQHVFITLTKRPERMREYIATVGVEDGADRCFLVWERAINTPSPLLDYDERRVLLKEFRGNSWPLPNLWLGVSVEDRSTLHRLDVLRQTPAAVRAVSFEPLLEDLGDIDLTGIDWVIVGGESGPGARPCNVEWIRSIVGQCGAAGVACFVKQLGANPRDRVCNITDWPDWRNRCHQIGDEGSESEMRIALTDPKGGDMDEWPADLRIRQWPEVSHVPA